MIVFMTILAVVVIVGFIIWLIIEKNKGDEIPGDNVKVYNYRSNYTNGHFEGYLKKIESGNERSIITFVPTDVDFNKSQEIKEQSVVVENNKIDRSSKSGLSENCTIMFLYPSKAEDLPEDFKKTNQGKAIMELVEQKNNESEVIDIKNRKDKNRLKLLQRDDGDDIVADWVDREKSLQKDVLDKYLKDERKSSYPGPGSGAGSGST